jgi:ribonuclease HI
MMPDTLHFDGSCDPNPGGRLGFGWVLTLGGEVTTGRGEESPARTNTNNVGEYRGLIAGLQAYLELERPGPLTVIGDSQLIIGQVSGSMRTKQPQLAQLCARARQLSQQIRGGVAYEWRRRAENRAADALASAGTPTLPAPDARTYAERRHSSLIGPGLRKTIADLNANPAPGFKEFLKLSVGGTDTFSALKLPELSSAAGTDAMQAITAAFPDDPTRHAAVLRWCLRGLAIELAIRKGQIDAEIAARTRTKAR